MIVIHILKYIFNLLFMIIICETGLKAIIKPFIKRKTNEEDKGFDEDIGKRNWQYVFKILIWILEIIPFQNPYSFDGFVCIRIQECKNYVLVACYYMLTGIFATIYRCVVFVWNCWKCN